MISSTFFVMVNIFFSDSNEKKLYLALAFNNPGKAKQHVFNTHRLDLTVSKITPKRLIYMKNYNINKMHEYCIYFF